ncbi:isopentenyl-diphosphate Delta-isomerase [Paraburkholderia sp. JHI2823]|uniref:isopentenyl-diphosphate Delta-isomerase n=1 Tax=Paraburkholderia sp. JHI2823 TaxID=3112960 RepID=UPI00317A4611
METCPDHVVLVNESDEAIGTAEKLEAHRRGLLHRAFSIFVIDDTGKLLLQRRAASKYHSGGLWANTCCGHPRQHEKIDVAANRRLREEMGFSCDLRHVGIFLYREPVGSGLIEHEIDHLFVGTFSGTPEANPDEVCEWDRVAVSTVVQRLFESPDEFTAWFRAAFSHVTPYLPGQPL